MNSCTSCSAFESQPLLNNLQRFTMKCPYCGARDHCVLESREAGDGEQFRRRRECSNCQKRFTTYERVEGLDLKVLKKDGRVEAFEREKIKRGLLKATWKRPVSVEALEQLIEEVERELRQKKETTVRSIEVGRLVVARLKQLDSLGYLLFASVYRDFDDITDFKREVDKLLTEDNTKRSHP